MKRFSLFLMALLVLPGLAAADIVVSVPNQTIAPGDTAGSLTVGVAITGSYDVAGYGLMLTITPRTGATGSIQFTDAVEASNYLFTLPLAQRYGFTTPTIFPDDTLYGDDVVKLSADGKQTIANVDRNLVTASFSIAPGTSGVFDVALVPDFTGLNGTDAEPLSGQSFVDGTLTVTSPVPEPATLVLLAAGGMGALIRRRARDGAKCG